jgi:hypothetical protein
MANPPAASVTSTRAGRYIQQPTGYRAFIPTPLPPNPPIQIAGAHRRAIADNLGRAAGNGHRVLEHLYEHPIVSVNEVQELIGTTYPAANDLVARLVDRGILQEITGQVRNRRFRYQSYIQLFYDSASGT